MQLPRENEMENEKKNASDGCCAQRACDERRKLLLLWLCDDDEMRRCPIPIPMPTPIRFHFPTCFHWRFGFCCGYDCGSGRCRCVLAGWFASCRRHRCPIRSTRRSRFRSWRTPIRASAARSRCEILPKRRCPSQTWTWTWTWISIVISTGIETRIERTSSGPSRCRCQTQIQIQNRCPTPIRADSCAIESSSCRRSCASSNDPPSSDEASPRWERRTDTTHTKQQRNTAQHEANECERLPPTERRTRRKSRRSWQKAKLRIPQKLNNMVES